MGRDIPLQMSKQMSIKGRKYKWLGKALYAGLGIVWTGHIMYFWYIENWNLETTSRTREKNMWQWSKNFWRGFYWLKDVQTNGRVEETILECYAEVEKEKADTEGREG